MNDLTPQATRASKPGKPKRRCLEVRGVCTHNLKSIDIDIPQRALVVVTGVSGSGKSSLAFDTLYAEGQRRFLESMSTYARQFLQRMEKPPLRSIANILPAIALRQRTGSTHARSSVGSVTELDDHLQLLYTHLAKQFCADCGGEVSRDTVPRIVERLTALEPGTRLVFVAEVRPTEEEHAEHVLERLVVRGFRRFWFKGEAKNIEELDVEVMLARKDFPVLIDRIVLKDDQVKRIVEAVDAALELGNGKMLVHALPAKDSGTLPDSLRFERAFRCLECGHPYVELIPALFNPNTTLGACPECTGFGKTTGLDLRKVIPNPYRSLKGGAVVVFETPAKKRRRKTLFDFALAHHIPLDVPWRELSEDHRAALLDGLGRYKGVRGFFKELEGKRRKVSARVLLARYRGYTDCERCGGGRPSAQARHAYVGGFALDAITAMTAQEAAAHFAKLEADGLNTPEVGVLFEEIRLRLRYMTDVGLGYLRLNRQTRTLSGGEFQRLHLTSSIGRALTDTLYVLDEPTAGLHARDSERLLRALQGLRDLGNTVVVVEHDPEIIKGADWAIEIGPAGGEGGGNVMFSGTLEGLLASDTATGLAMRERRTLPPPRPGTEVDQGAIRIIGATEHNLRALDVRIPLHRLVCITGVSGSGKSTLVHEVLYDGWRARQGDSAAEPGICEDIEGLELIEEVIVMSQTALGRSSRSNAATYTKAYDPIRKLLSETESAKAQGITPQHFSFNTKGGRCETCEGTGTLIVEMQFMADVELQCETCGGKRFSDPVLAVRLRGKNIDDILGLTIDEAMAFFKGHRAVTHRLGALVEVGLGYLRVGQTTATLSGGELQRLKLAGHIGMRARTTQRGKLFIFDEPTVGLHTQDVDVLISAIRRIVDEGHSVIVVEHNLEFIAAADWIIDLGPEGGDGGGRLVVEGTTRDVARCAESRTGVYLARLAGV